MLSVLSSVWEFIFPSSLVPIIITIIAFFILVYEDKHSSGWWSVPIFGLISIVAAIISWLTWIITKIS